MNAVTGYLVGLDRTVVDCRGGSGYELTTVKLIEGRESKGNQVTVTFGEPDKVVECEIAEPPKPEPYDPVESAKRLLEYIGEGYWVPTVKDMHDSLVTCLLRFMHYDSHYDHHRKNLMYYKGKKQ